MTSKHRINNRRGTSIIITGRSISVNYTEYKNQFDVVQDDNQNMAIIVMNPSHAPHVDKSQLTCNINCANFVNVTHFFIMNNNVGPSVEISLNGYNSFRI